MKLPSCPCFEEGVESVGMEKVDTIAAQMATLHQTLVVQYHVCAEAATIVAGAVMLNVAGTVGVANLLREPGAEVTEEYLRVHAPRHAREALKAVYESALARLDLIEGGAPADSVVH